MENEMTDGHAQLTAWNASIHFNENYVFARLDRGGDRQLPEGFSIHPTSDDTHFRLFSEPHDTMMLVATCAKYGGILAVNGLALKRAMASLVGVGEPVSRRPADVAAYFDALIATALPFRIPEPQSRTRIQMEQHIDSCDVCTPVAVAYGKAVDSGASITNDAHVTAMIDKAHANQAEAVAYYCAIADGRNALFATSGPAPVAPARARKAAHPITTTQEA